MHSTSTETSDRVVARYSLQDTTDQESFQAFWDTDIDFTQLKSRTYRAECA